MMKKGPCMLGPFLKKNIMSDHHKYIIIIVGPTAAGKTDFSLKLAQHMRAQIINMDMGQFYTPLSVGTAKPDWQRLSTPHHLFDIINEPKNITVTQYRAMVTEKINHIWSCGDVPILVGGSGFYLKSLLFPPVSEISLVDESQYDDISTAQLWQMLNEIDPVRARAIHSNDAYRIKRALAIWHTTGKKPSEQTPVYDPIAPFVLVHVTRDRPQLYNSINLRVDQMMQAGWLDEVATLKKSGWAEFLHTKKIIGYDDLLTYLQAEQTPERLAQTVALIAQKTRNYAKRQETFWRMLEKDVGNALRSHPVLHGRQSAIASFNLTLSDINLYIEQLLKLISSCDQKIDTLMDAK